MCSLRRLALVALLGTGVFTTGSASAQTTLRYQWTEGATLKYALEQNMKMTMTVMGNAVDSKMGLASEVTTTIDKVAADGSAKVTVRFGRTKMHLDSPMGKIEVDSENAQQPEDRTAQMFHKVVKGLAGVEATATLTPLGEHTDVVVPEKTLKALQSIPTEVLGDTFSSEGIKRTISQTGLVMPKEPISKGEHWKNKTELRLPFGKMLVETDFTYDGSTEKEGRQLEKILLKPTAKIDPDPKAPFALKIKSQEGTGTALFDNAAGRLIQVNNQQTTDMEADMMGLAFTIRTMQNTKMRLVEKK